MISNIAMEYINLANKEYHRIKQESERTKKFENDRKSNPESAQKTKDYSVVCDLMSVHRNIWKARSYMKSF
ncbi:serine hydroxymethyltransferase, cytosolic [Acrasis kona]|uniref:Serine hydroxymethyltransferase, cytosolic n=1 Tax=Acrasis kona TaxID=1008807 RepID=A0AAW2ZP07_9EUKA